MKISKGTLASLRAFSSLLSRPPCTSRPLHFQSIPSSNLLPSLPSPPVHHHYQTVNFSSQPNSISELILSNPWSKDIEVELQSSIPTLTHESVLYVLKKLQKSPQKAVNFFRWASVEKLSSISAATYGLMLRILAHKEWMKEFWIMVYDLSSQGFEIDKATYDTLMSTFGKAKMVAETAALSKLYSQMAEKSATDANVNAVIGIVSGSDWDEDAKKKLDDLKLSLSDAVMVKVLREVRLYPLRALGFFNWAGKQPGYEHSAVTYNAVVRILGREDFIEQFWSMVKEMKSQGHEMDIDTYIKLLRQFVKRKMMKEAVELYEFMMESPYKPSAQDCNVLLRQISLTGSPDLDLVFRVVRTYEAAGHSLSKAVYDGVHRSLTSTGRFDEAEKILKAMMDAGFEPDNITYSQLVFGLCKAGRLDEACKMLDEMEVRGCIPDLKTWTILIQGHCLAGEVDKALSCFTKMMEKNCDADADLLEVLVNGLCSKNKAGGAYTLFVEMVEKARLRPWQATFKHLIQKLLGEGKLEESMKLLHLMKRHNFPPFGDPFVHYISKFGTVEDAVGFLKALTVKQSPSSSAYLHVFESFFKEGRHSEAQDLLYKCPHHIRNHADILQLFSSMKLRNAA
ncbi:pentatricopeptide repeat-containing protein At3g48250, chloroplastic [Magnolia sinica]|uniref:pentatricopeptide repeat-containing protein At3g48250, chloroplastic n=1 Tax=Magnolia sinica TaxID=86752 RepID=UPI0026596F24|nr:pentatricopeptide repeat-containing protein At3g48250, chloroplastic [Magnolia sinica]